MAIKYFNVGDRVLVTKEGTITDSCIEPIPTSGSSSCYHTVYKVRLDNGEVLTLPASRLEHTSNWRVKI